MLYNMYKTMIKNAYNKRSIEELKVIKEVMDLTPMYYIINNKISLSQLKELVDLIDSNIEMIGG